MQTPPATCPAQNICVPSLTTHSETAKDLETKEAEARTTLQGRLKNTQSSKELPTYLLST